MDLNLFNNRKIDNNFPNRNNDLINTFIEELKNALKNVMNEGRNNLYETRKIFLDNKSWKGNNFAWVMDDKSVCLSKHGDGGPYFTSEIDLPKDAKVGEVYEKIDGKYVYNSEITEEINKIMK